MTAFVFSFSETDVTPGRTERPAISQPGRVSALGRALAVIVLPLLAVCQLSGCATKPPRLTSALEQAWLAHASRIGAVERWRADGRVAIKVEEEGWTASFGWKQSPERFDIQLSGPFGQGVVRLTGDQEGAELTRDDLTTRRADSAEALLAEQTGWRLPVTGLRYWIVGMPAPDRPAGQRTLDAEGRLAGLTQDRWQISYDSYQQVDGLEMPRKLRLVNGDVRVKLVIARWRTGSP
jgi:outer membrane lipoprotein LolB